MANYLDQLKQMFARLTVRQRWALGGIAAITVLGLGAILYFANETEYGVLFSDLRPEDASRITERLKQDKVPFKLASSGTTIMVPADKVSELRLQTAGAGLLAGGHIGFELFDKSSFGVTDFTEQINYKRALEGELARTIEGLNEVAQARVHITLPRESLFTEQTERAKASVVLHLKPGRTLSQSAAHSISMLLSSAVQGLEPANVTVLDSQGQILSAQRKESETDATLSHFALKQKFERDLAQRLISLLEPVVGVGKVRADVSAVMDFTRNEQTEENYDPQKVALRSRQVSEEGSQAQGAVASGIPGTRSNAPTQAAATPTPAGTASPATTNTTRNTTRFSETTNYEVSKLIRHTIDHIGTIKRLSVSVLVDNKALESNGKAQTPQSAPRSAEEIKQISELVAAAVGADPQRGDQIVVHNIAFGVPAETTSPSFWERYRDLIKTGIKYAAMVLLALMIILFVVRPMRQLLVLTPETRQLPAAATPMLEPAAIVEGQEVATAVKQLGEAPESLPSLEQASAAAIEVTEPALTAQEKPPAESIAGDALAGGSLTDAKPLAADEEPLEQLRRLEAEIERELDAEAAAASVNRTVILKRRLIEQMKREPEIVVETVRDWVHESDFRLQTSVAR